MPTDPTTVAVTFTDPAVGEVVRALAADVAAAGGTAHLVGGCVRDALLGRPSDEVDVEVFGLEVDELGAVLRQRVPVSMVGASFGVFKVHGRPIDVSVPRTETKVGRGHRGFAVAADPFLDPVTAAARRDFTINAMATNVLSGRLVDPFDGRRDLRAGVLRHTSDQFAEDPLRVLRGMQFVARFDLEPAPETVALCRTIEPEGLAPERMFDEWRKLLLAGRRISGGLRFLADTGWVRHVPELAALIDCPQDPEWHPEGDVWVHTGHVMDVFAELRLTEAPDGQDVEWENLVVGFASLCHDLGKPATTAWIDGRWRSPGHEQAGLAPTASFLGRLTNQRRLTEEVSPLVAEHLKPEQLYQQGSGPAAVRRLATRVGRLDRLLRVVAADRWGRPPMPRDDFPARAWLQRLAEADDVLAGPPARLVRGRNLIELGLTPGPEFGPLLDACYEAQLDGAITTVTDGLALVRRLLAVDARQAGGTSR